MWSAVQAGVPTFSWFGTTSHLTVSFLDNQLYMELRLQKAGDLGLGNYTMPTDASLDITWRPKGGGPDDLPITDLPGTLHITSYSATGIAGSFNTGWSGGGTLAGSFDVSF
jgi:hypothetical protein